MSSSIYDYKNEFQALIKWVKADVAFIMLYNGKCLQIQKPDGKLNLRNLSRFYYSGAADRLEESLSSRSIDADKLNEIKAIVDVGTPTQKEIKEYTKNGEFYIITNEVMKEYIKKYADEVDSSKRKILSEIEQYKELKMEDSFVIGLLIGVLTSGAYLFISIISGVANIPTSNLLTATLVSTVLGIVAGRVHYVNEQSKHARYVAVLKNNFIYDPANTFIAYLG